jgi:hypothetical protein
MALAGPVAWSAEVVTVAYHNSVIDTDETDPGH